MGVKKKAVSLKIIFLQYLLLVVFALASVTIVVYGLLFAGYQTGFYISANATELAVKQAENRIASVQPFDGSVIPSHTTYVLLSTDGTAVQSNMGASEQQKAVSYAKGSYTPSSAADCYVTVKRSDGSCVVHYTIRERYAIEWMNRYFPSISIFSIVLFLIGCLIGCFAVTYRFAQRLKKQLWPMMDAAQKIAEQDLDFTVRPSGIKEFNHVLNAITDMKEALKCSLTQQWKLEQARREQTSALAHDIKTPLTIIHGNAELLNRSGLTVKQTKYTDYILKNTDRMEAYLRTLIELTHAESGNSASIQNVPTENFIRELTDQMNGLATTKELTVSFHVAKLPQIVQIDPDLLNRAIMNIVSNAVEYSPKYGSLDIYIDCLEHHLRFCIVDSGKGFSPEDLKNAKIQFYQGDKSRNSSEHYGIGLYVTERIVELHHGILSLDNSVEIGGGKVTIEIPVQN